MEYTSVDEEAVIARAQAVNGGGAPYTQEAVVFYRDFEYVVGQRECEGARVWIAQVFAYRPDAGEEEVGVAYAFALQAMMRLALEN
jgi:hypothetical protein